MKCQRRGCATEFDRENANEPVPTLGLAENGYQQAIFCDTCSLAVLVLAYSREEPPYVDIGLYSEVVFYARQLAAGALGREAMAELGYETKADAVNHGQEAEQ